MKQANSAELRELLGLNLVLLARLYRRELDNALDEFGLSEAAVLPVRYLGRLGHGIRQGALAEALYLEGPSLIRVLGQLIELGLVERREDPADGRAKIVTLTASGKELNRRLAGDLGRLRRKVFDEVTDADMEACLRAFDKMALNIRRSAEQDALA